MKQTLAQELKDKLEADPRLFGSAKIIASRLDPKVYFSKCKHVFVFSDKSSCYISRKKITLH